MHRCPSFHKGCPHGPDGEEDREREASPEAATAVGLQRAFIEVALARGKRWCLTTGARREGKAAVARLFPIRRSAMRRREARDDARKLLAAGKDPSAERKAYSATTSSPRSTVSRRSRRSVGSGWIVRRFTPRASGGSRRTQFVRRDRRQANAEINAPALLAAVGKSSAEPMTWRTGRSASPGRSFAMPSRPAMRR